MPNGQPLFDPHRHASHCVEYLRQSLMCSVDASIERKDDDTRTISGVGSLHVCRDFAGLIKWAEQEGEKTIDPARFD